jgi:hypothetical protein
MDDLLRPIRQHKPRLFFLSRGSRRVWRIPLRASNWFSSHYLANFSRRRHIRVPGISEFDQAFILN